MILICELLSNMVEMTCKERRRVRRLNQRKLDLQYETIFWTFWNLCHTLCDFLDILTGHLHRDDRSKSIILLGELPPLQLCETREEYISKINEYARALEKFWATKIQDPEHLRAVLLKIKELEESSVKRNRDRYFTFFDEDLF